MSIIIQECSDCGLFSRLSRPIPGTDMRCPRCAYTLRQVQNNPIDNALACAITALLFYLLTLSTPMLEVTLYGKMRTGTMVAGFLTLDDQGFWMLATVIFLTTIFLPLIKIFGSLIVLTSIRLSYTPPWIASFYALLQKISPWTMIEVYLVGFIVAYTRLAAITNVYIAVTSLSLGGLMISMVAMDATLDPEAVWEKIKARQAINVSLDNAPWLIGCDTCFQVNDSKTEKCLRCAETLHNRKPNSLMRACALTTAAAILYIPSNLLPIMDVTRLGKTQSYTIYGGIRELAHIGLWPLALLVFVASIVIPLFKLVTLTYMLITTRQHSSNQLRNRTRLYRVIDFIGRWSMVDIFMVSILVALMRFGWVTKITANTGAVYFAGVVILTLFAVKSFDPRLMWDVIIKRPSCSLTGNRDKFSYD